MARKYNVGEEFFVRACFEGERVKKKAKKKRRRGRGSRGTEKAKAQKQEEGGREKRVREE